MSDAIEEHVRVLNLSSGASHTRAHACCLCPAQETELAGMEEERARILAAVRPVGPPAVAAAPGGHPVGASPPEACSSVPAQDCCSACLMLWCLITGA